MKSRKVTAIVVGLPAVGLMLLIAIYLWSARIPEPWQQLSAGMNRSDIESFLGSPRTKIERDRDVWIIDRPIGIWTLLVSYHDDGTFRLAHLDFKSAFPREFDRARNYG